MTEPEALDRIQALALMWAQKRLTDNEAMSRIIAALEAVGRPLIAPDEDG